MTNSMDPHQAALGPHQLQTERLKSCTNKLIYLCHKIVTCPISLRYINARHMNLFKPYEILNSYHLGQYITSLRVDGWYFSFLLEHSVGK